MVSELLSVNCTSDCRHFACGTGADEAAVVQGGFLSDMSMEESTRLASVRQRASSGSMQVLMKSPAIRPIACLFPGSDLKGESHCRWGK
jgi:hypothetical protein